MRAILTALSALAILITLTTACGPDNPSTENEASSDTNPCPHIRSYVEGLVDLANTEAETNRDILLAEKTTVVRLVENIPDVEGLPALPPSRLDLLGSYRTHSMPEDICMSAWSLGNLPGEKTEIRLEEPLEFTWRVATAWLIADVFRDGPPVWEHNGVLNTVYSLAPNETGSNRFVSEAGDALVEGAIAIGESENFLARWATPVVHSMLPRIQDPRTRRAIRDHISSAMETLVTENFAAWSVHVSEQDAHRTACMEHRARIPSEPRTWDYPDRQEDPQYTLDMTTYRIRELELPASCRGEDWTSQELQVSPPVPQINPSPDGQAYDLTRARGPLGLFLRRWLVVESRKVGGGDKLHAVWLYWGTMAGHELRAWKTCEWAEVALERVENAKPLLAQMYRQDLTAIIAACPKSDADVVPADVVRELTEARGAWTPSPPSPIPSGFSETTSNYPPPRDP